MSRITLRRVVLLSCAHLALTLGLMLYGFTATSAEFDDPSLPRSATGRAAGEIAAVLMLPARLLWTRWASEHLPDAVEWLLLLGNSWLWGSLVIGVSRVVSRRRGRGARR